jgi:hypothetical protein
LDLLNSEHVNHFMEAHMHPLTKAIPRFIQIVSPLPLLKPMVQSQRGVEERHVQVHPFLVSMVSALPRFIQAAKARAFE